MTKLEAAALVAMLVNAFPSAKFTEENSVVYEQFLADLPPGEAQAAIGELIHSSRYLPTVAEIRGEVTRARRAAATAAVNQTTRLALPRHDNGLPVGPSPAEWGKVLGELIDARTRHQAMARAWYAEHGKPVPPYPAEEYIAIAQAGARGEDVRSPILHAAGVEHFEETERRYP